MALLYSFLAAGMVLLGGLLIFLPYQWRLKNLNYFIAFAAGSLLSLSLVEILPESTELHTWGGFYTLVGFLLLFLFDSFLHPHHHPETKEEHKPLFLAAWTGLLIHSWIDGLAIGVGFKTSPTLGALITLGIVLHKLVDGLTSCSLLLTVRASAPLGVAMTAGIALATPAGTVISLILGGFPRFLSPFLLSALLGLTAGTFIYVATADLLPYFHGKRNAPAILSFISGASFFALVKWLYTLQR